MSFEAAGWAIRTELVETPYERLVLIVLADCHNAATGRCDPSIEFIAKRCHISRRSVERAITALEERGVLTVKRRKSGSGQQMSNAYKLHLAGTSESRTATNEQTDGNAGAGGTSESRTDQSGVSSRASEGRGGASHSREPCVTQSHSRASESRTNQELYNQELETGGKTSKQASAEAWSQVVALAGNYRMAEKRADPRVHEVVQEFGGWRRFGEASQFDLNGLGPSWRMRFEALCEVD